MAFHTHFEWDEAKATHNYRKHGITFELAATVFNDPLMLALFDKHHSETEDRWITLGQAENQALLVVIHTYQETNDNTAIVRIIFARPATKHKQRQYETIP